MMKDLILETPRSVRVVRVIETTASRGLGVEGNVIRLVTQHWSLDGELLAENDPCPDKKEIKEIKP